MKKYLLIIMSLSLLVVAGCSGGGQFGLQYDDEKAAMGDEARPTAEDIEALMHEELNPEDMLDDIPSPCACISKLLPLGGNVNLTMENSDSQALLKVVGVDPMGEFIKLMKVDSKCEIKRVCVTAKVNKINKPHITTESSDNIFSKESNAKYSGDVAVAYKKDNSIDIDDILKDAKPDFVVLRAEYSGECNPTPEGIMPELIDKNDERFLIAFKWISKADAPKDSVIDKDQLTLELGQKLLAKAISVESSAEDVCPECKPRLLGDLWLSASEEAVKLMVGKDSMQCFAAGFDFDDKGVNFDTKLLDEDKNVWVDSNGFLGWIVISDTFKDFSAKELLGESSKDDSDVFHSEQKDDSIKYIDESTDSNAVIIKSKTEYEEDIEENEY